MTGLKTQDGRPPKGAAGLADENDGQHPRVDDRHGGPGTRVASVLALVACVSVALMRQGDGIGGDTVDYLAAADHPLADTRFTPGLPLLLAPFGWGPMRWMMVACTVGLVVVMWLAARRLGGSGAALVCALFILASPALTAGSSAVMSDRPAALLVVGALLALAYGRDRVAGVLVGLSGWVRLVHCGFVAGLPRRALVPAVLVVAGLVVWQLAVQGSVNGYSQDQASWSLSNVTGGTYLEITGNLTNRSNLEFFPAILLGFGGFIAPLAVVVGVVEMWLRRGPLARFTAGVILVDLAVHLPYFFQSARFMLPACCLLTVWAAVGVRRVVLRLAQITSDTVASVQSPIGGPA